MPEQGNGVDRTTVTLLAGWLTAHRGGHPVRPSYHPANTSAARLYRSLGFVPTGAVKDGEIVAELAVLP